MNVAVCLKRVFISSIHRMMRARAFIQRHPFHMATSFKAHTHSYKYLQLGFIHGPREAPALNLSLRTNSHGWLLCCAFSHLLFFPVRLFFSITFHISFVSHIASHRIVVCHFNAHISNSHRASARHTLSFQPAIAYLVVALSLSLSFSFSPLCHTFCTNPK